jgi:hypothetical protein
MESLHLLPQIWFAQLLLWLTRRRRFGGEEEQNSRPISELQ